MAQDDGRAAVSEGGLDQDKIAKAFAMVAETQDMLAVEEFQLAGDFALRILKDPGFVKMSGTARFIALFNVIQWGVETIERVVAEGFVIKPN